MVPKGTPHALLAEATGVERRGIEVADAERPGGGDGPGRVTVGDRTMEVADLRTTEPEHRQFGRGAAQLPRVGGSHRCPG